MGPRLGGRGDWTSRDLEWLGKWALQWGRGSVAAETTEAYVAPYTEGV